MTRFLLCLVAVLAIASLAEAAHRTLFGVRVRERVVVRERGIGVFRGGLLRAGSGCAGIQAGGCIGTVRAGCAGVTVGAGCSGWTGPAMVAPAVKVVPGVMPQKK